MPPNRTSDPDHRTSRNSGEAMELVAVDGSKTEQDEAFKKNGSLNAGRQVVKTVEVPTGGGIKGSRLYIAAQGEPVGLHMWNNGLLKVECQRHHGHHKSDLCRANGMRIMRRKQGQGEEQIQRACEKADAVQREQGATDDKAGKMGIGHRLEGNIGDGEEKHNAAHPKCDGDETQGAEGELHARGLPVRAGSSGVVPAV